MQRRFQNILAVSLLRCLALMAIALPPALGEPHQRAPERLPLTPVFAAEQDGPEFAADFENKTPRVINIPEALQASFIVLDGKTYKRQYVLFAGNASLRPGASVPITIDMGSYLHGFQRQDYSASLTRWRWKSPLNSGRHTLLLNLDGKEYGPVAFIWNSDSPSLTMVAAGASPQSRERPGSAYPWHYPYLVIRYDGIGVVYADPYKYPIVKPQGLAPALSRMPRSAWRNGRTVGITEIGRRTTEQARKMRRLRTAAVKYLKRHRYHIIYMPI
jgi:hypothetical protein